MSEEKKAFDQNAKQKQEFDLFMFGEELKLRCKNEVKLWYTTAEFCLAPSHYTVSWLAQMLIDNRFLFSVPMGS